MIEGQARHLISDGKDCEPTAEKLRAEFPGWEITYQVEWDPGLTFAPFPVGVTWKAQAKEIPGLVRTVPLRKFTHATASRVIAESADELASYLGRPKPPPGRKRETARRTERDGQSG